MIKLFLIFLVFYLVVKKMGVQLHSCNIAGWNIHLILMVFTSQDGIFDGYVGLQGDIVSRDNGVYP